MISHLPEWLRFAIAIGPLVVVVAAHGSGGALATVSVSLNRTTLPAIATILAVIAILNSASPEPHKATKPSRPHAAASATAGQVGVVEAFFTAINDRDWQRVWQLGGKNLGTGKYSTYHAMISGYRCTDRDVLVGSPTSNGEVVSGSFRAYEANGAAHAVQRYVFSYVVRGSVIVSGQFHVSGSPPPGC